MTNYFNLYQLRLLLQSSFLPLFFFSCAVKSRLIHWAETSTSETTAENLIVEEFQNKRIFSQVSFLNLKYNKTATECFCNVKSWTESSCHNATTMIIEMQNALSLTSHKIVQSHGELFSHWNHRLLFIYKHTWLTFQGNLLSSSLYLLLCGECTFSQVLETTLEAVL